jgi:hypothetical protein
MENHTEIFLEGLRKAMSNFGKGGPFRNEHVPEIESFSLVTICKRKPVCPQNIFVLQPLNFSATFLLA